MTREEYIRQLKAGGQSWDFVVIGGGATGLGIAVDAASRGFSTLLLEQSDFAKATSSRSTKLVHGGVRYLQKGDVALVREALRERGYLRKNAPHLVRTQPFLIGNYKWWEKPFYTIGLIVYDLLSGKMSMGRSRPFSREEVIRRIPRIVQKDLKGGVMYYDGQFDDARLAVNLMQTAVDLGAVVVNHCRVSSLVKDSRNKVAGIVVTDELNGGSFNVGGRSVINATGIFVDNIIKMDNPDEKPLVRPSQGIHLVVDKSFLGGSDAIMIPKTSDGRVMFGVPWHNRVILGTTDIPVKEFVLEPKALEEEIGFILETAGRYLDNKPRKKDVLCVFAGLRPLAAPRNDSDSTRTKEISRSHKLIVSASGLVTITGGKWTTYRIMAEDTIDTALRISGLPSKSCTTRNLKIHGYDENSDTGRWTDIYGSDCDEILSLEEENPAYRKKLHEDFEFTVGQVIWAVRKEMARTIEYVLARRIRVLFLDAKASVAMAPIVAEIMADELNKDKGWQESQVHEYTEMAKKYIL